MRDRKEGIIVTIIKPVWWRQAMLYLVPFGGCGFLSLVKPIRIGLQLGRDN